MIDLNVQLRNCGKTSFIKLPLTVVSFQIALKIVSAYISGINFFSASPMDIVLCFSYLQ